MKIPLHATAFTPHPVKWLSVGDFRGQTIRHTFRKNGTGDWLIMYTVAGSGLYRFEDRERRSVPGDISLYRPGSFHDYQFAPEAHRWDLLWAHFTPRTEWLDWLDWPEVWPGLLWLHLSDPEARRRAVVRLREMVASQFRAQPRKHLFGMNALEEVLLWCDAHNPRREAVDPRVRKSMDYLASHLSEPFREERVARAAGLSPSRLRHLFHTQTGDSPRRFLEEQRLRRARELLALSRQTIGEIATELGFASPFYFSLRFKKSTGESPRQFRTRALAG